MTKFLLTLTGLVIGLGLGFGGYYYVKNKLPVEGDRSTVMVDPENATYQIEDRKIPLKNGSGQSNSKITSLDYYEAELGTVKEKRDINTDGLEETLVIINYNSGGTGVFSYLGVAKAGLLVMPTIFIGDRVIIQSLEASQGVITINYLDRKEGEAMAAVPTVPRVLRVGFSNNQLKNLNDQ
jgi:hypothetical protein